MMLRPHICSLSRFYLPRKAVKNKIPLLGHVDLAALGPGCLDFRTRRARPIMGSVLSLIMCPFSIRSASEFSADHQLRGLSRAIVVRVRARLWRYQDEIALSNQTWQNDRQAARALAALQAQPELAPGVAIVGDLLTALRESCAAARLLQSGLSLQFDRDQPIEVPSLAGGGTVMLEPRKFSIAFSISESQVLGANADLLVADLLARVATRTLDEALFGAAPNGLRAGVAPCGGTAGPDARAAMTEDLARLADTIACEPVFVMHPAKTTKLSLLTPAPLDSVVTSAAIAKNDIIAIATDALACATSNVPTVDVALGSETIRIELGFDCSWTLRDPHAIAWLSASGW